jgi:hypothetical protein
MIIGGEALGLKKPRRLDISGNISRESIKLRSFFQETFTQKDSQGRIGSFDW